jgi:hypothetical protein
MLLQEISQILAIVGNIYASQEEKILTTFKNIYASWEVRKTKNSREHHQEDLEGTKEPWKSFDEEKN